MSRREVRNQTWEDFVVFVLGPIMVVGLIGVIVLSIVLTVLAFV